MKAASILILSDTHGDVAALAAVFQWAKKRDITTLAFLGDGAEDLPLAAGRTDFWPPWKIVRGNGDHDHRLPIADTLEVGGKRFFLCHGHHHGVQEGLDSLISTAKASQAQGALFGHTHRPYYEEIEGLLVLNPGSLGKPRGSLGPSFATVEVPEAPAQWFLVQFWVLQEGLMGKKTVRKIESYVS
jgi:hypothetical protein